MYKKVNFILPFVFQPFAYHNCLFDLKLGKYDFQVLNVPLSSNPKLLILQIYLTFSIPQPQCRKSDGD